MSFMWPRTVTIARPSALAGVGFQQPYSGQRPSEPATMTPIASGLPASVQAQREGQRNPTGLPTDGNRPVWRIFIKPGAITPGIVRDGDIVTDDIGRRYEVVADYFDSLGYRLHCERLEA